jgi:hypothetical protein
MSTIAVCNYSFYRSNLKVVNRLHRLGFRAGCSLGMHSLAVRAY